MYGAPALWDGLMSRLTTVVADFLVAQAAAGAQVLQLFDSWVGALSPGDYRRYVLPYTRRVFDAVRAAGVPSIHFGTGTATLLEAMVEAGGDVIGLDWRVPIDEGWARIGPDRAVQGNLDPAALFAPKGELRARVRDVVRRAGDRPGHIFNVGHGLLPTTPPDRVQLVVDTVREAAAGAGAS
jgi:uroporphyrinogen decarboxylase